jgi:NAD(P)-dependent dehydrogenase (short-subunit alcohol dehydrogenase family)
MTQSLRNQTILITGAASGLGRQLALELGRAGAAIAAVDLQPEPLEALVAELRANRAPGAWAVASVTDRTRLEAAVAALEERLGPIDVLIANAGIAIAMPADRFCPEDLEQQVQVNLVGVANSIAAVLPAMLERGSGHLVAISSLGSFRGFFHGAGYCASKAGVNALMDSLRLELRPRGIRCTTVCPGWIRTPLAKSFALPKPGALDVDQAARRIVRAVRRQSSFCAFPLASRVVVSLLRWLPNFLTDGPIRAYMSRRQGTAPKPGSPPRPQGRSVSHAASGPAN